MPPKKPTTTTGKAPAKTTAAAKTTKATKTPAAKTTKPTAPKEAEKKETAPPPKEVVIEEIPFKQVDAKVVWDKEGKIKESGKWALIIDENSLTARFLRHRDVNMLTVPDAHDMEPEYIRKAVLGSIKFGKPLVVDMMESETFDLCTDKFNDVLPGLMDMILTKSIIEQESYMQLVKESDGQEFQNKYDYNVAGFSFVITTSYLKPSPDLLQKTLPFKIAN